VRPVLCDRSREWISLRLDDEISQFEHVLLRSHMLICSDCRRFAYDVNWQTNAVRQAPLESLGRAIKIPRHGWTRRAIEIGTAATAAAAAAVALAVGLGGSHARPTVPQPQFREPTSAFETGSRGLPNVAEIPHEHGVVLARGRRALSQL
jgi:Putative zinc-finger